MSICPKARLAASTSAAGAQIAGRILRGAAELLHGGGHVVERGLVAPGEHHVTAFGGERQGDAAADAAARAGDECDLAGQSEIHFFPLTLNRALNRAGCWRLG